MALKKAMTDEAGVTTEYIRVAGLSHDRDTKALCIHLKVYKDAAARKAGMAPVKGESITLQPTREKPGGGVEEAPASIKECYELVKSDPAFSGAEDV